MQRLAWRTILPFLLVTGACGYDPVIRFSDAGDVGETKDGGDAGTDAYGKDGGLIVDAKRPDGAVDAGGSVDAFDGGGAVATDTLDAFRPLDVGGGLDTVVGVPDASLSKDSAADAVIITPPDTARLLDSPIDRSPDTTVPIPVDAPSDTSVPPPDTHRDAPLAANGAACGAGSECLSNVCADGVCCDQACGNCFACTKLLTGGTDGVCAPILNGQDPHSTCADETASNICGKDGLCDGAGSCRYVASGRVCEAASCSGNILTNPSVCNGTGLCVLGSSAACPNSTACLQDGTGCGTTFIPGVACTDGSQCANGNCVDNAAGTQKICCTTTCPTCKGCAASGTSCVNKTAGVADLTCGTIASDCRQQSCDGAGACQLATDGTACGQSMQCQSGVCQTVSSTILADDFTSTGWTNKSIGVWPGYTPMTISIADGKLVMQDPGAWSTSYIKWNATVNPTTSFAIQADMTASSTVRSLDYVMIGNPDYYIIGGLQRDEGVAVLFVGVGGAQVVRIEVAGPVPVNQTQLVRVEVLSNGTLRLLVDGVLLIEKVNFDLTQLPSAMDIGVGANAYEGQTFTFDNLLVTRL